jgi:hypothetical protein
MCDKKKDLKGLSIFRAENGFWRGSGRPVQNIYNGSATGNERFRDNPDHQEDISNRIGQNKKADDREKEKLFSHQWRGLRGAIQNMKSEPPSDQKKVDRFQEL